MLRRTHTRWFHVCRCGAGTAGLTGLQLPAPPWGWFFSFKFFLLGTGEAEPSAGRRCGVSGAPRFPAESPVLPNTHRSHGIYREPGGPGRCRGAGAVPMLWLPPGLGVDAPPAGSARTPRPSPPSLHDALAAFAPPHHERRHEQRDQDGQHDEGAQHAVRGVVQRPARRGAVPEVLFVHGHEELVHQPVGPVAVEPLGDQRRAVRQLPVGAAKHRDSAVYISIYTLYIMYIKYKIYTT